MKVEVRLSYKLPLAAQVAKSKRLIVDISGLIVRNVCTCRMSSVLESA